MARRTRPRTSNRSAYTPPVDAVQEVRVKVFDTDTAFGHTNGGTINMVLKTGTNQIHGTAYEFDQPTYLTANNFFNNRNGLGNPATHFQSIRPDCRVDRFSSPRYTTARINSSGSFPGENDVNSQPNTAFMSVPTAAEKQGNFSQILQTDGTQLYDPYSNAQTGTTIPKAHAPTRTIRFRPASSIRSP